MPFNLINSNSSISDTDLYGSLSFFKSAVSEPFFAFDPGSQKEGQLPSLEQKMTRLKREYDRNPNNENIVIEYQHILSQAKHFFDKQIADYIKIWKNRR